MNRTLHHLVKTEFAFWDSLCRSVIGRGVAPHPGPLPKEREGQSPRQTFSKGPSLCPRRCALLPLPRGVGRGEGKRDVSKTQDPRTDSRPQPLENPFSRSLAFLVFVAILVWSCFTQPAHAASLQTQTFNLHPGWNSIWLEVTPTNNTVSEVFSGVPIESVWTFAQRLTTVDFIQNPNEPVFNRDQWLLHVPTNRVESFQNSLFALRGQRAYLVQLAGSAPATLRITGRPALERTQWATDAYTLRGLAVNPAAPPSFGAYFQDSAPHYDQALRRLRGIYRLAADGVWRLADADDKSAAGEAYWILTRGASDHPGPVAVSTTVGDGLEFRNSSDGETLTLENRAASPREVRIMETASPDLNPLNVKQFNATNGVDWVRLFGTNAGGFKVTLAARESRNLRLTVRRDDVGASGYSSVLVVADNTGTRRLVPLNIQAPAAGGTGGVVRKSALPNGFDPRLTGLWFGSATVTNVSEAHSGTLVTNAAQSISRTGVSRVPTPTDSEFTLRLIVHVDTNGTARLLKEVIQMRTEPTYTNDASGRRVLADPGRFVLVTDETKITKFAGVGTRAGQAVGRRMSSVDFDFPGAPERNFVEFGGTFALGETLSARIVIEPDFVTNPFKHKYHPDHDNLTADFKRFQAEAYSITRLVQLIPAAVPQGGKSDPGYGNSRLEGEYLEEVQGLHRETIVAAGSFQLSRISSVGVLND